MKAIWSPWRMAYIENSEKAPDCVFCAETMRDDGPENLIVYRGKAVFVILNRFPYTSGHLMIVPFAHQANLALLGTEARAEMMELASRAVEVLRAVYRADAFNLGINIGKDAGAGIVNHVHLHVVPRWAGDTNFMSTVGEIRVLPEELPQTYLRVREAWASLGS